MATPKHDASCEKLAPETFDLVRDMIAKRGIGKTALVLRTTEGTLHKLIEGPGLTLRARDRIEARAIEVTTPAEATLQIASFESDGESGQARGMFFHAEVSGANADAVGELLGTALGIAAGIR